MGMFFYSINHNGNPKKPVLPQGAKLNYGPANLPFDYIDLSRLNDVNGMDYMFCDSGYTSLPPMSDTSRFRSFNATFANTQIIDAPAIDTSGAYNFAAMFNLCYSLVAIPRLNISGCTDPLKLDNIFNGCINLETIGWEGNINASLDISSSAALDDATILSTCYHLYSGAGAQSLRLNAALSAKAAEYVKLNAAGDGLVFCDAADPDTLGTLADYAASKGWTILFS